MLKTEVFVWMVSLSLSVGLFLCSGSEGPDNRDVTVASRINPECLCSAFSFLKVCEGQTVRQTDRARQSEFCGLRLVVVAVNAVKTQRLPAWQR